MDDQLRQIAVQAAAWVVEIHDPGFANDRERQARFHTWLARSRLHEDAYHRATQTFRRLRYLDPTHRIDLDVLTQRYFEARLARLVRAAWRPCFTAAATIALCLGLQLFPQPIAASPVIYATRLGEQQIVTLDDGSVIQLNTQTRIAIEPVGRYRMVHLVQGEVFFAIVHDAWHPFRLFTPELLIENNQGQFDVAYEHGSTRAAVVGGEIFVRPIASSARLTEPVLDAKRAEAMERFALRAGNVATIECEERSISVRREGRSLASIARTVAWREGLLSFNGQTVEEVAALFNRYNELKLAVTDPDVATLRISGDFRMMDPQSFILALQHLFPTYAIVADTDPSSRVIRLRRVRDNDGPPTGSAD